MTMYRTQTANVLNDADRFERIMAWQLFTYEQNAMLWNTISDDGWEPGDPLFNYPIYGAGEQYVRPIIQEIEDGLFNNRDQVRVYGVRCEACEVTWRGDEPCFSCGTDIPDPYMSRPTDWEQLLYSQRDVALSREMYHRYIPGANPGARINQLRDEDLPRPMRDFTYDQEYMGYIRYDIVDELEEFHFTPPDFSAIRRSTVRMADSFRSFNRISDDFNTMVSNSIQADAYRRLRDRLLNLNEWSPTFPYTPHPPAEQHDCGITFDERYDPLAQPVADRIELPRNINLSPERLPAPPRFGHRRNAELERFQTYTLNRWTTPTATESRRNYQGE